MKAARARVGALCADSLPFSQGGTLAQAQAMRADGIECLIGYLGVINSERVGYVLEAGMAFLPVTLANHFDGGLAGTHCRDLGLPAGVTVHTDLEGSSTLANAPAEIAAINAWATVVSSFGYNPALYVGVPQPLTSEELWHLAVRGYWHGQGSIRDRNNALAEPNCGWWATQAYPSQVRGGTLVDLDMLGEDFHGRIPTWVIS